MSQTEAKVVQREVLVLEHVEGPAYISAIATGMSVSGPSGDGFLHVTFYRDMMRPSAEEFTMTPESDEPGNVKFNLASLRGREPRMYREDVATISLLPAAAEAIIASLRTALDRSKG